MSTPAEFVLNIGKFVKKAKANSDLAVRKIVLDIGTRVIKRSPVGDDTYWKHPAPPGYIGGHFRANWQYGENTAPVGVLPGIDPSGGATIRRLVASVQPGVLGKILFLTNNLPYAQRLEQGWSVRQAPAGMVGVTLAEYRDIIARAIRETNP